MPQPFTLSFCKPSDLSAPLVEVNVHMPPPLSLIQLWLLQTGVARIKQIQFPLFIRLIFIQYLSNIYWTHHISYHPEMRVR